MWGLCYYISCHSVLPSLPERNVRVMLLYILPQRITLAPGEECEGYVIIYLATAYYPRYRRGMWGLCYYISCHSVLPSLPERNVRVMLLYILPQRITLTPGEECERYVIIYLATSYYPHSRRGMWGLCYYISCHIVLPSLPERNVSVLLLYILPQRITLAPGEECERYVIIYLATSYYPRSRRGMWALCYYISCHSVLP